MVGRTSLSRDERAPCVDNVEIHSFFPQPSALYSAWMYSRVKSDYRTKAGKLQFFFSLVRTQKSLNRQLVSFFVPLDFTHQIQRSASDDEREELTIKRIIESYKMLNLLLTCVSLFHHVVTVTCCSDKSSITSNVNSIRLMTIIIKMCTYTHCIHCHRRKSI